MDLRDLKWALRKKELARKREYSPQSGKVDNVDNNFAARALGEKNPDGTKRSPLKQHVRAAHVDAETARTEWMTANARGQKSRAGINYEDMKAKVNYMQSTIESRR